MIPRTFFNFCTMEPLTKCLFLSPWKPQDLPKVLNFEFGVRFNVCYNLTFSLRARSSSVIWILLLQICCRRVLILLNYLYTLCKTFCFRMSHVTSLGEGYYSETILRAGLQIGYPNPLLRSWKDFLLGFDTQ